MREEVIRAISSTETAIARLQSLDCTEIKKGACATVIDVLADLKRSRESLTEALRDSDDYADSLGRVR